MQSALKLKKELEFNTELKQVLDVLKGTAASQFRQIESRKERFAAFTHAFEAFFQMIDFNSLDHPFARAQGRLGIVIMTSDEGFMGGLNTKVINRALAFPKAAQASLIVVGERGAAFLKGLGHGCTLFPGISHEENDEGCWRLRDYIVQQALKGMFSRLVLFYPKPVSFTQQRVESLTMLPCTEMFEKRERLFPAEDLILDSSVDKIVEYLFGAWVLQRLLEVFEDSKLSELSARVVHLEGSNQVLQQRERALKNQYFRSHHELVDRGMRDIFSSQLIRQRKQG
ncbi:MAG: F0F1 ATP synthase subunit gamma [Candidatus Omnitrophica bacterium]|nr:F0F1 ATP synthase subunit gamma [Candidatus Omnitrophota bacterium]